MVTRLWWKDLRDFRMSAVVLTATVLVIQQFGLWIGQEAATAWGTTAFVALFCAGLYAVAVGAAAFAGEREQGTLSLLDRLAVPRGSLWLGKTSFAVLSAAVLLGLMLLGGRLGLSRVAIEEFHLGLFVGAAGLILLELSAWSLLMSALLRSAIAAAVLALLAEFVLLGLVAQGEAGPSGGLIAFEAFLGNLSAYWPLRLVAVLATGFLGFLVIRQEPGGTWSRAWGWDRGVASEFESFSTFSTGSRRRGASPVARIAWQTWREAAGLRGLVWGMGIVLIVLLLILDRAPQDGILFPILLAFAMGAVAGTSAFVIEGRTWSQRFYLDHGVGAGTVWLGKFAAWATILAIGGLPSFLLAVMITSLNPTAISSPWVPMACIAIESFLIAAFFGMLMGRGVIAFLLTILTSVVALGAQLGLNATGMTPLWTLACLPIGLVLITFVWTNDWLHARFRPWRYARAIGWVAALMLVLFLGHATQRVVSVPWIDPPSPAALMTGSKDPQTAQRFEAVYPPLKLIHRELKESERTTNPSNGLGARLQAMDLIRARAQRLVFSGEGDLSKEAELLQWLRLNEPLLPRIESAAQSAGMVDFSSDGLSPAQPSWDWGLSASPMGAKLMDLSLILGLRAREQLGASDLAGAWRAIVTTRRLARQVLQTPTIPAEFIGVLLLSRANDLAQVWALDRRQTAESLRAAEESWSELQPLPGFEFVILHEDRMIRDLLQFDRGGIASIMNAMNSPSRSSDRMSWTLASLSNGFAASPWECARLERVLNWSTAWSLRLAALPAFERPQAMPGSTGRGWGDLPAGSAANARFAELPRIERGPDLAALIQSTPTARYLQLNDRSFLARRDGEAVDSRIVGAMIRVRLHALEHGGAWPQSLKAAYGDTEPPIDPYSGRPLGYRITARREVISVPALPGEYGPFPPTRKLDVPEGTPVLWSIGPDLRDQGGQGELPRSPTQFYDLIGPILFSR